MNIQPDIEKPQYLSFYGVRNQLIKRDFSRKNITLKDKFISRKRDANKFIFTYDRLLKECEEKNKNIQLKKKNDAYKVFKDLLIKQLELLKKTCYFNIEREKIQNKNLYQKLIERCFSDIDNAVINGESQEKINKLSEILELFVTKYSHYGK